MKNKSTFFRLKQIISMLIVLMIITDITAIGMSDVAAADENNSVSSDSENSGVLHTLTLVTGDNTITDSAEWISSENGYHKIVNAGSTVTLPDLNCADGEELVGWSLAPNSGSVAYKAHEEVVVTGDITLYSITDATVFDVNFTSNNDDLWTVKIPYGYVLWQNLQKPWTADSVSWKAANSVDDNGYSLSKATVNITSSSASSAQTEVTKHTSSDNQYTYYTFEYNYTHYFTYGGESPEFENSEFTSWKMTEPEENSNFICAETTYTAQFSNSNFYAFNTHYSYKNGITAYDSENIIKTKSQLTESHSDGAAYFDITITAEKKDGYNLSLYNSSATGVVLASGDTDKKAVPNKINAENPVTENDATYDSESNTYSWTLHIYVSGNKTYGSAAFVDDSDITRYLSLYVVYIPNTVEYKFNYYFSDDSNTYSQAPSYSISADDFIAELGNTVYPLDLKSLSDEQLSSFGLNISEDLDGYRLTEYSKAIVNQGYVLVTSDYLHSSDNLSYAEYDADSKCVNINIYYLKRSRYVYYMSDGEQISPQAYVYGQQIQSPAASRAGYTFLYWNYYKDISCTQPLYTTEDGVNYTDENGNTVSQLTMPATDVYANAEWESADSKYSISIWVENPDENTYTNRYTGEIKAKTGTTINLEELIDEYNSLKADYSEETKEQSSIYRFFKEAVKEDGIDANIYTQFYYIYYTLGKSQYNGIAGNVVDEAFYAETEEHSTLGMSNDSNASSHIYTVQGDGTTNIDIVFNRNMYTVAFNIAYKDSNDNYYGYNYAQTNSAYNGNTEILFTKFDDRQNFTEETSENGEIYKKYEIESGYAKLYNYTYSTTNISNLKNNTRNLTNILRYELYVKYGAHLQDYWPTVADINTQQNDKAKLSKGAYYCTQLTNVGYYYETHSNKAIQSTYNCMDKDLICAYTNSTYGVPFQIHTLDTYWHQSGIRNDVVYLYELYDGDSSLSEEEKANAVVITDSQITGSGANAIALNTNISKGDYVQITYNGKTSWYLYEDYQAMGKSSSNFVAEKSFYATCYVTGVNAPTMTGFTYNIKATPKTSTSAQGGTIYLFYTRNTYSLYLNNINDTNVSNYYKPDESILDVEYTTDSGETTTLRKQGVSIAEDESGNPYLVTKTNSDLSGFGDTVTQAMLNASDDTAYDNIGRLEKISTVNGEKQWEFSYWYGSQEVSDNTIVNFSDDTFSEVNMSLTIYASWTAPLYLITFDLQGGKWQGDTPVQIDDEGIKERVYYSDNDDTTVYTYIGEGNHTKSTPTDPTRESYSFSGWYLFSWENGFDESNSTFVRLKNDLDIYEAGMTYYDNDSGARLLATDSDGNLGYYEQQTGIRYLFDESQKLYNDTYLYAVWKSSPQESYSVYNVVSVDEVQKADENYLYLNLDGSLIKITEQPKVTINGKEYYLLYNSTTDGLSADVTYSVSSHSYYTHGSEAEENKYILIPDAEKRLISLTSKGSKDIESTAEYDENGVLTSIDNVDSNNTACVHIDNSDDTTSHDYFVFFFYTATESVPYRVYYVDEAVAGTHYDVDNQPDEYSKGILFSEIKYHTVALGSDVTVTENAIELLGYTPDAIQKSLRLTSNANNNVMFFYYKSTGNSATFGITYHLTDTSLDYSLDDIVISGIPAAIGSTVYAENVALRWDYYLRLAMNNKSSAMPITIKKGNSVLCSADSNLSDDDYDMLKAMFDGHDIDVSKYTGNISKYIFVDKSGERNLDIYMSYGSLTLTKVDANDSSKLLSGVGFTVTIAIPKSNGNFSKTDSTISIGNSVVHNWSFVEDDNSYYATSPQYTTDNDGTIKLYGLPVDEVYSYEINETKGIEGYNLLENAIEISLPYTSENITDRTDAYNKYHKNHIINEDDEDVSTVDYYWYSQSLTIANTSYPVVKFHSNYGKGDDLFAVYIPANAKPENTFENVEIDRLTEDDKISPFYDIPDRGDEYVFAGWYYDKDNSDNTHPIKWNSDTYTQSTDIYAHWIEVGTVAKDSSDKKSTGSNSYGGFELFGTQIRNEELDPNYDPTDPYYANTAADNTGLRFAATASETLLEEVNSLFDGHNYNDYVDKNIEYGFVMGTYKNATTFKNHYTAYDYSELKYNAQNVNGEDTRTYYAFVKNVNCTSRIKGYNPSTNIVDHRNYDDYRIYTVVVSYANASASDKANKYLLVRAYLRYVDSNGLLRTFYNDYNGNSATYCSCKTNFDYVNEAVKNQLKTLVVNPTVATTVQTAND
jgi:hypothetical protein